MQSACTCGSSASELSASEMSMITDPSDESASGEFGRVISLSSLAHMHRMLEEIHDPQC